MPDLPLSVELRHSNRGTGIGIWPVRIHGAIWVSGVKLSKDAQSSVPPPFRNYYRMDIMALMERHQTLLLASLRA